MSHIYVYNVNIVMEGTVQEIMAILGEIFHQLIKGVITHRLKLIGEIGIKYSLLRLNALIQKVIEIFECAFHSLMIRFPCL